MGSAPSPVQNQSGLKYPDSAPKGKLSDLLTTAHQSLSALRDHYANMVNNVADAITAHANLTPEAAPVQKDLGTAVRAGMNMYGIPTPARGAGEEPNKGSVEQPLLATVPKAGEEAPPIAGLKGVKIPKGEMDPGKIVSTIEDAASKGHSLVMTYNNPEWDEPKVYHVEPYSYRQTSGEQTLMAYDKTGKGIRAFKVGNIVNVAPTGQEFKPRWDVEIGAKPKAEVTQAGPKVKKQ
jgi:WYL domain-containing protein